jgi:hypothetical protein
VTEDPDMPPGALELPGLNAVVFKPGYTEAFMEMPSERKGGVTDEEWVDFIKAVAHIVEHFAAVEKEVTVRGLRGPLPIKRFAGALLNAFHLRAGRRIASGAT